ncbi:putative 2OG-Fe(II) oxygenase [Phenylobacterium sp.]
MPGCLAVRRRCGPPNTSGTPAPGTVFLWESWLRDEVPPNRARTPRISISFNYAWGWGQGLRRGGAPSAGFADSFPGGEQFSAPIPPPSRGRWTGAQAPGRRGSARPPRPSCPGSCAVCGCGWGA